MTPKPPPVIFTLEANVATPDTESVEPSIAAPDTPSPVPILTSPDTPIPPVTTTPPDVDDVELVLFKNDEIPVTPNVPETCNLYVGVLKPTPTLPEYSPMETVPSAWVLNTGKPETSLILNIVPLVRLLLIENN